MGKTIEVCRYLIGTTAFYIEKKLINKKIVIKAKIKDVSSR